MATEQPPTDEPTIGRLVNDASRDISTLIRKEIELAKSEIKVSAKFGVMGAAMFAVAGFVLMLAVIMLSVAIAYFIHWNGSGLSLHWAFLIVFGLYVLIAAILVLIGVKKVKQVGPPERAIEQGRGIPQALKGQTPTSPAMLKKD